MKKTLFAIFLGQILVTNLIWGQKPNFTANTTIPTYTGSFAYGSNPGYFGNYNNNAPNDKLLHDLFNKINLHTTRVPLYDGFLEQWGPNIRINEFDYYTKTLAMHDLTVFLNEASNNHRETATITCGSTTYQSWMFKNMYEPIWDDSTNGKTPINDQNYFAAYMYKVAKTYGKYIKFYEIWNEPDFVDDGNLPLRARGTAGNWWENNPDPCDLKNMRAPITQYVRMLRIAYEVIKSVDPNALVTTGGLGYENFLDALLRNTDSPNGQVTNEYPLTGGAYFDVISFHSYPQYNLSYWSNSCGCRVYQRHSDNAANKVIELLNKFKTVLKSRGYNGVTYPEKYAIITETNIPAQSNSGKDHIGSPTAQRNFAIKMFVQTQKYDIKQTYIYKLGNSIDESLRNINQEGFDVMGLYYNLNKATPTTATPTDEGIAVKSTSDFLYTYTYDSVSTKALNLPFNVDGAAFKNGSNMMRYVLWAKTSTDQNENTTPIQFSFPASLNVKSITAKAWDYSKTNASTIINNNLIALMGSPQFITTSTSVGINDEEVQQNAFTIYPNPANKEIKLTLNFTLTNDATISFLDTKSIEVSTSILKTGQEYISINNLKAGVYTVLIKTLQNQYTQKLVVLE